MKHLWRILGLAILLVCAFSLMAESAKKNSKHTTLGKTATKIEAAREVRPVTGEPQQTTQSATLDVVPITQPPLMEGTTGAAAYEVPWQSVNAGGQPATSANYSVNASIGQSTIGYAASTNYQAGIGYWYGTAGAGGGCSCPYQCDYDEDGFLTALDLGSFIDVLFAGRPEETDPDCPTSRGDFDNDGFPTALDLGNLIDHLFAGGGAPCDPCDPVQSTCAK